MFYLFVALVVTLLAIIYEKIDKNKIKVKNKKIANIIIIVSSILILSLVAGFRKSTIGADVNWYVLKSFNMSSKHSLLYVINHDISEPGFVSLVWIVTNLFHSFSIVLFTLELFILIFIYKFALYTYKNKNIHFYLIVFIYVILCYFESFCIIRQHMALAILLYSLKFIDQKKWIRLFGCLYISTLFHSSSLTFLLLYLIYYYIFINKKPKLNNLIRYTLLFGLIVFFLVFNVLFNYFTTIGILPSRYITYSTNSRVMESMSSIIFGGYFIFISLWLTLLIIFKKVNTKSQDILNHRFSILSLIICLVLRISCSNMQMFHRVLIYFFYLGILFGTPTILKIFKDKKGRLITKIMVILVFIIYFVGIIVLNKSGYNIYPYETVTKLKIY